jgi:hypothetical protein
MTAEEQISTSAEGSAAPEPSAPNIVRLPNGHTVTLHPKVTIPIGVAGASVINANRGHLADIWGGLAEVYLHLGIAAWTFKDAKGEAVPITPDTIDEYLPFDEGGLEVAEAADRLYQEPLMRPLLRRQAAFSAATQMPPSTSPPSDGGSTPPRPSGSSSSGPSEPSPEP